MRTCDKVAGYRYYNPATGEDAGELRRLAVVISGQTSRVTLLISFLLLPIAAETKTKLNKNMSKGMFK